MIKDSVFLASPRSSTFICPVSKIPPPLTELSEKSPTSAKLSRVPDFPPLTELSRIPDFPPLPAQKYLTIFTKYIVVEISAKITEENSI